MVSAYLRAGKSLPPQDAPFNPADPAETHRSDPAVSAAMLNIVTASQITATVSNPAVAALNASQTLSLLQKPCLPSTKTAQFHISSCFRVASELNVLEILLEAGLKGLHAREIAKPSVMLADAF
ncbi:hypothetical protein B0H13DRAFT_2313872 [Mycena leptocephala]|nr:hypothetical protein B0H13DRAFT_2313872 [Mycena leptocephala]